MFFRADCGDYDDKIGSEEIWYSFKSLIRKHDDKDEKRFNIYDCIILNEPYHTTSINDFILKSQKFHPKIFLATPLAQTNIGIGYRWTKSKNIGIG